MKVLFDHQIFQAQQHGGVSRYFVELIRHLAKEKDLNVVELLHAVRHELECRVIGWHVAGRAPLPRVFRLLNRILFAAFASVARADIYHATYFHVLAPWLRVRRVLTIFDMIAEFFPLPNDPTATRKRKAAECGDLVFCISECTRRDATSLLGLAAEKTRVIPLSGELQGHPKRERPMAEPYLLYVGQRGAYKNADVLLRAVAGDTTLRTRFRLVFFGGAEWSVEERNRLQELGLDDRVTMTGGTDDELATWYAHASAFVYPSLYEGFGVPPLEAMQFDCPVIASRDGSLPEVIGDAGLFFDPHQAGELSAALRRLDEDTALRENLIARGRECHRRFTWTRCALQTAGEYRQLLKDSAHRD